MNIRHDTLTIRDPRDNLLVKVQKSPKRLYNLPFHPVQPVCLTAHNDSASGRWHARLRHLHLEGLQKMSRGSLVRGMPVMNHVKELCVRPAHDNEG